MKLGIITATLALTGALLVACPACKPSTFTPGPDAAGAAPPGQPSIAEACSLSCAALASLGCKEGAADAGCVDVCVAIQSQHTADLRPWCVMDAGSADAVNACGGSASCTK